MIHLWQMIEKGALFGGASIAATYIGFGQISGSVFLPYIGAVPFVAFTFGIGVVTSLAVDVIHSFVIEEVAISHKAQDQASMVLGAVSGAAVMTGALYLIAPSLLDDYGLMTAAMIVGGSELAGSFIYNLIVG